MTEDGKRPPNTPLTVLLMQLDRHIELADCSTWHPWHGPLHRPYRFHYRDDREYRLHSAATGLL